VLCCLLLLLAAGCEESRSERQASGPEAPAAVSVGQPVPPVEIRKPARGTIELRAPGGWFAARLDPPPGRPRDACVLVGEREKGLLEADTICDVLVRDSAASMIRPLVAGAVLTGVAPRGVRAVRVAGPGRTRTLPLSAGRAFLAVFRPTASGRVRVVSELERGATVRSFSLPLSRRWSLRLHDRHRRRGAVFNDEIGEQIMQLSYTEVVDRFGPPARIRRERGERCAYYEVVGFAEDGWRFCFSATGRMTSAAGGSPPGGRAGRPGR
jgi:hypothetical protein